MSNKPRQDKQLNLTKMRQTLNKARQTLNQVKITRQTPNQDKRHAPNED
jgi:hypothetical protein